jgi:SH3-like domain-containing protein
MPSNYAKSFAAIALGLILTAGGSGTALSQTASAQIASAQIARGPSGLPLPRFVTLKSKRVNLRVGPSSDYAVSWLYMKAGLPVEIIQEYDNWRRIRDSDGTEGWVNQSLLSGQRAAIAAPWMKGKGKSVYVNMRRDPQPASSVIARLEPGVAMTIRECTGDWCKADTDGAEGWVAQAEIWGAYPGEAFK